MKARMARSCGVAANGPASSHAGSERPQSGDHHHRQHVDGRVELAQHGELRGEADGDAERHQVACNLARIDRAAEHDDDAGERERHRDPGARRHALAQHEPARERGEQRRDAHQHERVGDRRAGQRADEEEERARRAAVPASTPG